MNKLLVLTALSVFFFACTKKEAEPVPPAEPEPEVFSAATYQVTVTGKWNSTDFNVPQDVHFTRLAGAVHSKNVSLWKEGALASKSLEAIAENGNSAPTFAEVDSLVNSGKSLARISATTPPPTGPSVFTITANTNFPQITFASMLAPTPDWFFGVSSLPLYRNGAWLTDTTLQLYSYDGGTEEGDIFGYNNPETNPQQPIRLLTTTTASVLFKGPVRPIAEIRIQKQ